MSKEEQDRQLKQLAVEAQQCLPRTQERQLALTKLIKEIQRSGRLYRPPQGRLPHKKLYSAYEDIYAEAKQKLMFHICKKIDEYNPERGEVLTWINRLIDVRFFNEAIKEYSNFRDNSIVEKLIPFHSQIDRLEPENSLISGNKMPISEELLWFIQQDPDSLFKQAHIEGNSEANFQTLALRKLEGQSSEEIAEALKIKISTLYSFYNRCLKKFAAKFQEYLEQ